MWHTAAIMTRIDRGFTLTWLGHHTFRIDTRRGLTLLLDPWVESNPACPKEHQSFERIDVITISHGHGDHMGDAVTLAKKFHPPIVCNVEIHKWLRGKGVTTTTPMNKGGTQEVAGLRFTMVHATHSSGIEDGGQVLYGGEPCGFVIALEDGTRIYHAGDTGVHADMALIGELYAPDVALLPIGDHYTMGPREAALAARMLKPRWIVPAHFGTFPVLTGTPDSFRDELKKAGVDAKLVVLDPGGSLS